MKKWLLKTQTKCNDQVLSNSDVKSLPNIKTPTKCNDQVLSNSDVKSLPNIKTPTKCNDQVLSKSDVKSLPNIKTPTKCNDQVLSNSDVKSLPNMLNTNWMQDLYKIIDPIMKTRKSCISYAFHEKARLFKIKCSEAIFNDSH